MRRFRHLTRTDRLRIEALLRAGITGKEIARQLGVAPSTICYERKKGLYTHRNSDWAEDLNDEQVQALEDWVNRYPRKLHKWQTAEDMLQKYLHSSVTK